MGNIGWGYYYVIKRKYYLIILMVDKWKELLMREIIKVSNYLMYGVIYCNGFGYLLCINIDGVFCYFFGD